MSNLETAYIEHERDLIPYLRPPEFAISRLSVDGGAFHVYAKGEVYRALGNYFKAEESFRHALRIEPQHPLATAQWASLVLDGEDRDFILSHLKSHRPSLKRLHLLAGLSIAQNRGVETGIDELRTYTESVPDDPTGWAALGNMLLALHRRRETGLVAVELMKTGDQSDSIRWTALLLLARSRNTRVFRRYLRKEVETVPIRRVKALRWVWPLISLSRREALAINFIAAAAAIVAAVDTVVRILPPWFPYLVAALVGTFVVWQSYSQSLTRSNSNAQSRKEFALLKSDLR